MAAAASTKPDNTDVRLVATTQTSRSSPRERHSDSAKYTASWVLPQELSQSRDPASAAARPGVTTTVVPGVSAAPRSGADSGLPLKPSAIGGTAPDLTGHAAAWARDPAGPVAVIWLSTARYPRSTICTETSLEPAPVQPITIRQSTGAENLSTRKYCRHPQYARDGEKVHATPGTCPPWRARWPGRSWFGPRLSRSVHPVPPA